MAVVEAHASVVPTSLTNSHQSETTVLKTGDSQHCELLVTKAAKSGKPSKAYYYKRRQVMHKGTC